MTRSILNIAHHDRHKLPLHKAKSHNAKFPIFLQNYRCDSSTPLAPGEETIQRGKSPFGHRELFDPDRSGLSVFPTGMLPNPPLDFAHRFFGERFRAQPNKMQCFRNGPYRASRVFPPYQTMPKKTREHFRSLECEYTANSL